MGIFPITPLVRHVQRLIIETFDVSEQQAEDCAAELVALAEGWGSAEAAAQLDWPHQIKKDLGEAKKFKWRSEEQQMKFETAERRKYQEMDAFIREKRIG